MSEFTVKASALKKSADTQKNISKYLQTLSSSINDISGKLVVEGSGGTAVRANLKNISEQTISHSTTLLTASDALIQISEQYMRTENGLCEKVNGESQSFYTIVEDFENLINENIPETFKKFIKKLITFLGLDTVYDVGTLLYKLIQGDAEVSDFDFLWEKDADKDAGFLDKTWLKLEKTVLTEFIVLGHEILHEEGVIGLAIKKYHQLERSASKKMVSGNILGGLWDLGCAVGVGLGSIGFGVVEVYSHTVGSMLGGTVKKAKIISEVTGLIPGEGGKALNEVSSAIEGEIEDFVDGFNDFGEYQEPGAFGAGEGGGGFRYGASDTSHGGGGAGAYGEGSGGGFR